MKGHVHEGWGWVGSGPQGQQPMAAPAPNGSITVLGGPNVGKLAL